MTRDQPTVDIDRVADAVLPHPFTPEDAAAGASLVSELIRRMNHATRARLDPVAADAIVGRLVGGVASLAELMGHLAASLDAVVGHPLLAADSRAKAPARNVADDAAIQLQVVADQLGDAHLVLKQVHSLTARLYLESDHGE